MSQSATIDTGEVKTVSSVVPGCGPHGAGGDGEEGVREHRQGDVPVPGAVLADLVAVQAGLVLRLRETVLNQPLLIPVK
jgi:hypothetical protein